MNHGLRRFLSCMIAMGLIMYTHLMKNGNHSLVCICYCTFELHERKRLETIWEGARDNDWNGKGIKRFKEPTTGKTKTQVREFINLDVLVCLLTPYILSPFFVLLFDD